MPEYKKAVALAALALATLALLGCADQARHQQAAFDELKRGLPGVYDNSAQAADRTSPSALAVTVSIVPIGAQLIGDAVYFVRETAADNAHLVLSQRIWTLTLDPQGTIVQHGFLLKEPRRWLAAAQDPDLLVSLLPADLQPLAGCDLEWQQTDTGFETTGAPMPRSRHVDKHVRSHTADRHAKSPMAGCRPGPEAQGLWIEQSARLSGSQLSLSERRTGANGELEAADAPLSLVLERAASSTSP